MFKTVEDINLDELKKNYARLYFFGLGFIQLKIDETSRLHFYHPKLPPFVEEPHNHRYNFKSTILQGELTQNYFWPEQYKWGDEATHRVVYESCDPNKQPPALDVLCKLTRCGTSIHPAGSSYMLGCETFHTVSAKDNCITYVERWPDRGVYKDFSMVIREKDAPKVCPFSVKIEEEELWKLMEEMVNAARS